jgi:cytochrome c peroxidase
MQRGSFKLLLIGTSIGVAACNATPQSSDDSTAADSQAISQATRLARLGKKIFFDTRLSEPEGQACASCHSPNAAFTDPNHTLPVSRGATPTLTGNRNAPTAAYAQFSPPFAYSMTDGSWVGGQFWDGRASSLEDQAKGPFLNPVEMANPSKAAVVSKIQHGSYARDFKRAFGPNAFDDIDTAYDNIAHAIATFERTKAFAPFSSKFDAYQRGEAELSDAEARGLALFNDPQKGNCAACHPSTSADGKTPALFTDFTYDNLGIPRNAANPFFNLPPEFNPAGQGFVDHGLMNTVNDPQFDGHFKVGTLRNITETAPYMHNGYFTNLRDVVSFYNSRDVASAGWEPAEIPATVNHTELGNLGLVDAEIDDIVSFLGTLTDGYDGDGDGDGAL